MLQNWMKDIRKRMTSILSRCYNRGESNEFTKYHRSVLEAKLYLGHEKENCIKQSTTEIILAKKVMHAKRKNEIYKHFFEKRPRAIIRCG